MTDVIIKTNFGSIKFGLLPELAPETVRNFVTLAKKGFMMELCSIESFLGL